jgi:hypothetical protein
VIAELFIQSHRLDFLTNADGFRWNGGGKFAEKSATSSGWRRPIKCRLQNVRCLRGGIDAWAQEVEPKMRRYKLG